MIKIKVNKEALQHSIFSDDENLIPANLFLEKWFAGDQYFTFTSSGSTGNPKEITLSRTFIAESAQRTIDLFNISPTDNILLALNTSFMGGLMMVARALIAKCTLIYIPSQFVTKEALEQLPSIKLASFVPAQLNTIFANVDKGVDAFSNINNVLVGGAPINKQLQAEITKLSGSCTFYHTYGMTETASHVALKNVSEGKKTYTALSNYTFEVDKRDCLTIHYKGATAFTIQTNDIVKLISTSSFEWIGRADWVINSGGVKFSMETAEDCVSAFFNSKNIKTLFTSHKTNDIKYGERWVLIIEGEPLGIKMETELCNYCKQTVGKYSYPKEIKYTKKIVYLSSGKIDRSKTYASTN